MTVDEIRKLCNGEFVKIGKNQIIIDEQYFIVEKYEYTDKNGENYYSVIDGFELLEDAINSAENNQ